MNNKVREQPWLSGVGVGSQPVPSPQLVVGLEHSDSTKRPVKLSERGGVSGRLVGYWQKQARSGGLDCVTSLTCPLSGMKRTYILKHSFSP